MYIESTLTAYSAFFSDLLDLPSMQSPESAPVELDHSSETVRLFVDLIVTRNLSTQDIPTGMMLELFSICDKFQMEEVDIALMKDIRSRLMSPQDPVSLDPWSIFKYAANRGDIDMARTCIQAFEDAGINHQSIYRASPSHFVGIPGNFVTALLLAGYDYNDRDIGDETSIRERSWYRVSILFRPL
jgi:hypothetical protein